MSKPSIHAVEQLDDEAVKVAELKKLFGCVPHRSMPGGTHQMTNARLHLCRRIPEDLTVLGDQEAAYRRFLVARKWTVADSHKLLNEVVEWRGKFNVDAFLVRSVASDPY